MIKLPTDQEMFLGLPGSEEAVSTDTGMKQEYEAAVNQYQVRGWEMMPEMEGNEAWNLKCYVRKMEGSARSIIQPYLLGQQPISAFPDAEYGVILNKLHEEGKESCDLAPFDWKLKAHEHEFIREEPKDPPKHGRLHYFLRAVFWSAAMILCTWAISPLQSAGIAVSKDSLMRIVLDLSEAACFSVASAGGVLLIINLFLMCLTPSLSEYRKSAKAFYAKHVEEAYYDLLYFHRRARFYRLWQDSAGLKKSRYVDGLEKHCGKLLAFCQRADEALGGSWG